MSMGVEVSPQNRLEMYALLGKLRVQLKKIDVQLTVLQDVINSAKLSDPLLRELKDTIDKATLKDTSDTHGDI